MYVTLPALSLDMYQMEKQLPGYLIFQWTNPEHIYYETGTISLVISRKKKISTFSNPYHQTFKMVLHVSTTDFYPWILMDISFMC